MRILFFSLHLENFSDSVAYSTASHDSDVKLRSLFSKYTRALTFEHWCFLADWSASHDSDGELRHHRTAELVRQSTAKGPHNRAQQRPEECVQGHWRRVPVETQRAFGRALFFLISKFSALENLLYQVPYRKTLENLPVPGRAGGGQSTWQGRK